MNSALLVIDVQIGVIEEGAWNFDKVLQNILSLATTARLANAPVIYIHDRRVDPNPQLHPDLDIRETDLKLEKGECDSFIDTSLKAELGKLGVTRVVICGLQTDACVEATTKGALAAGYEVVLVSDAHTTADWDGITGESKVHVLNTSFEDDTDVNQRISVLPSEAITFG